jgi:hypothetical protein
MAGVSPGGVDTGDLRDAAGSPAALRADFALRNHSVMAAGYPLSRIN